MYDVMISGYYGFKNSGDDALLMAMIDNLRTFKEDIKILVLSMNPKETKRIYGVDAINRFNVFQILRYMRRTKLLINGGGSLIQDITSTQSLMYYLGIIWVAKKLGCKVMVYANGIGPIDKSKNRKRAQGIINDVDMITLREPGSKQELKELGVDKPPINVTADPAITLEPTKDIQMVLEKEGINTSKSMVGFSLRDWKGEEKKYGDIIAHIADYMVEKYDVTPVFIPMHYPSDVVTSKKIVSKMKHTGYVIEQKHAVTETLAIVNQMELLIGMRLHALIYAATLGVPVIGLVYEPKVEGFLAYAKQASAGHVGALQYDILKQIVDDIWERRIVVQEELKQITMLLREKALENARIAVELLESE